MDLQLHPLRDSTWAEIFPILSLFKSFRQTSKTDRGRSNSTKAQEFLRNEAVIQRNQSGAFDLPKNRLSPRQDIPTTDTNDRSIWQKIAEFNDPQRALGAGISSYHQQLVHLFFLFLILLFLHIPAMVIYNSYNYYQDSAVQSMSLGNMGFSSPICLIESMQKLSGSTQKDLIQPTCTQGKITKLHEFGITTMFEDQQVCSRSRTSSSQYCDQFIHDENFKDYFQQNCIGKKSCTIS